MKQKKEEKKHDKLLYLGKNKLYSIEMLISRSVEDGIIDHNEFLAIIKEKNRKQYDNEKNEGDKSKLSEAEIV